MDQPKLERLLSLVSILTDNFSYSVDDIALKLGISRRTVFRYLDTFRSAGFAVHCREGYYRLVKTSRQVEDLSSLVHFTKEEAYIVGSLLESLDDRNALKANLKRKLASVYEMTGVVSSVIRGHQGRNVNILAEAIRLRHQVRLTGYWSSHSGKVKDYLVEPFAFTANYVQVWCFDVAEGICKQFLTSRIRGEAIDTETPWQHEADHREALTDVFRISSSCQYPICLRMSLMARNLLVEEYPLSERDVREMEDGRWVLETMVSGYQGVGRFVMGLLGEVEIVDSPSLRDYVRSYLDRCGFRDASRG